MNPTSFPFLKIHMPDTPKKRPSMEPPTKWYTNRLFHLECFKENFLKEYSVFKNLKVSRKEGAVHSVDITTLLKLTFYSQQLSSQLAL